MSPYIATATSVVKKAALAVPQFIESLFRGGRHL